MPRTKRQPSDEEMHDILDDMEIYQKSVSNKEVKHIDNKLKKIKLKDSQAKMIEAFKENEILFVFGPAGTAKTFTSCYCALDEISNNPEMGNIILVKPTVEASKSLGALPGDQKEKTDPYMASYYDNFSKIIGGAKLNTMIEQSRTIKIEPLQYMRGRTFDNSVILLDEAQNCNYKELMLCITRLGKNSKMIIFGDTSQYDIREKDRSLKEFFELFQSINNVGVFEFKSEDIVRATILVEITKKYEEWRKSKNLD